MNTIYTIGYEGVNINQFLSCLKDNNIEILVDVRQHPISRKAGFSQCALKNKVNDSNISYIHFQSLGCPDKIRDSYKDNGDWNIYCRSYNYYLNNNKFVVESLASYLINFKCALLCFEANPERCHRLLIAKSVILMHPELIINNLSFDKYFKKESPAQLHMCLS